MSVATAPVLTLAPTPEILSQPFRLSVAQYHAMIETGIIAEDALVELLEGCLITKMPKNPPHSLSTELVRDELSAILPSGWIVASQEPITLENSEPEPDVIVIRGKRRDYQQQHPLPRQIGIVIEIAQTTLTLDRQWKKRLYAASGIPVFWIVNLQDNLIEVYTEPAAGNEVADYQERKDYFLGDSMPVSLDGEHVGDLAVSNLLPLTE